MDDPGDQLIENAVRLGDAWRFIRRTRSAIVSDVVATSSRPDLEGGDVDTLDQIALAGGAGQMSDIACGLRVDPSTATRAVDRLANVGLVERYRDPDDGRVIRVALTDSGSETQAELRDARLAFSIRLLKHFEPEDQEAIGRLLPMLVDALAVELGSEAAPARSKAPTGDGRRPTPADATPRDPGSQDRGTRHSTSQDRDSREATTEEGVAGGRVSAGTRSALSGSLSA